MVKVVKRTKKSVLMYNLNPRAHPIIIIGKSDKTIITNSEIPQENQYIKSNKPKLFHDYNNSKSELKYTKEAI